MNINDRVISVEEFWRGWSSTEALIVILLVVITFLLIQLNSKRRKRPAFTKEEWEEAVATWYEWEFSLYKKWCNFLFISYIYDSIDTDFK